MKMLRFSMQLGMLAAMASAQAQVQTMRPGSYGMVPDQTHVHAEKLSRDVAYQAGRLRPEEQVKNAGFWGMLDSGLRRLGADGVADTVGGGKAVVDEMRGNVPSGTSRNADVLAILGDAEERKRLRAQGMDIIDAIDDREGGLQAMVVMDRDTADRVRALRNSGTPEGEAQARILLATSKATLAFRGTEPRADKLGDVTTNADANGRVGKSQYDAQRPALSQLCGSYGNLQVTGHSLGGAQAQRFAVNCPVSVKEVVTFAAPAIGKDEAEIFAQMPNRPRVTHYVATHDIVSAAGGQNHIPGTVREVSFENVKPARNLDTDSLLAAHSQFMLSGEHKATIREKDYVEYQEDRISQHYELKRVLEGKFDQALGKGVEYAVEKGAEKLGKAAGGTVGGLVAGQVVKQYAGWMAPVVEKCDVLHRVYHGNACNGLFRGVQSWARAAVGAASHVSGWEMPAGPEEPGGVLAQAAPAVDPNLKWGGVPILAPDTPSAPQGAALATGPAGPAKEATPAGALFVDAASPEEEAAFRANLQGQRESAFARSDAQVTQISDQQRAELHRQQDEGRAQLRAGLQALAGGLAAVQQQQQAYSAQMEAQRQAQNARMAQASQEAMARGQNRITQGAIPQAGQPGYPVLDPFAARYQQQRQMPLPQQVPASPSAQPGYPVLDPFAARYAQPAPATPAPTITTSAAGAYPGQDPFASQAPTPASPGTSSSPGETLQWAVVTHSIIPGDTSRYRNNCTVVAGTRAPPATPCGKEQCGTTPYTGEGGQACHPSKAYTGAVRVVGPFGPNVLESAEKYCARVMSAPHGLAKIAGSSAYFCI